MNDAPINQPRRKDREVKDTAWIQALLQRAPVGVLATSDQDQPFVHINLFVYEGTANVIYLHSAQEGRTPSNLRANPKVSFGVSEMGRLLPADTALEFSVEFSSVIVFGLVKLVEDRAEAERGLQLLLDKYFPHLQPGRDYRPIQEKELARTAVYRLEIDSWSGKRKKVDEDFPGAFLYPYRETQ